MLRGLFLKISQNRPEIGIEGQDFLLLHVIAWKQLAVCVSGKIKPLTYGVRFDCSSQSIVLPLVQTRLESCCPWFEWNFYLCYYKNRLSSQPWFQCRIEADFVKSLRARNIPAPQMILQSTQNGTKLFIRTRGKCVRLARNKSLGVQNVQSSRRSASATWLPALPIFVWTLTPSRRPPVSEEEPGCHPVNYLLLLLPNFHAKFTGRGIGPTWDTHRVRQYFTAGTWRQLPMEMLGI